MRNLGVNQDNLTGSINRLSTGLRINSAGDDPAGMIVSENMRAQIKGIQQAIRNSQDAVNMTKTAEGALDEVSRLLNSIRAIAVSSANTAVVDANQLQANQSSIRSVIDSLDRIADQTTWGSKKLLNGASGTVSNITQTSDVSSLYIGSEINGKTVRSGDVVINRVTAATKTTTGQLATTFAASSTAVNAGVFAINGTTFTVNAGDTVADVISKINEKSGDTGVQASFTAGQGVVLTSTKFGSHYPIQYTETTNILNGGASANPAVGTDAVFTVTTNVEPSPNTDTETFTGGVNADDDGLTLTSTSGNTMTVTAQGNATAGATTIGSITVGAVRFQIGANANQSASFGLPSVFASALGGNVVSGQDLSTLDVTTEKGATDAIQIIDAAISQVATIRGKLGSFQQNFLESNVRSLGVAQENLTASESTIRDADMAQEMSDYTRYQILGQAGISVLAQANQNPRSVLSLLQQG